MWANADFNTKLVITARDAIIGRMVARSHPVRYTFAEYLAHEDVSNTKHEYLDGQIYGMAGGTPEHSALIASVTKHLGVQLSGSRCRVHSAALHIRVQATGLATYPDVTVVCGPWERDPDSRNTVTNPTAIVEVLSHSTEAYDRGEKFEHYRQIEALREYVLVSQDASRIEVRSRASADAAWTSRAYAVGERASLPALGAALEVDAVYEDAREPT